ncbi:MAG: 16S rRNA (adenine(1518)-N(6)/adenine(1519)-N(6))-dimethyltransferase RsmA [Clostridia bacterium]|jgi:16S rRNA (adenine1518-N6/adenine1519-N6)-dimethyltransferase|nr:ribosomal RNA small subunit methyltransferase A [Clostridium sp. CAG:273]
MVNIYNMNNIYEETKFLMKKYNLTANKKLGQNFLVDSEAINSIVASANLTKKDMVIEIGPGLGTLTSMLIEKAGKVIAIELDDRMIKILGDRFLLYDNFELINEDVLKVDLSSLIEKNSEFENIKVVANLPYYITTPIIMKLLENRLKIESITIMIQKEVAERIVATPGSKLSGAITYSVHYYAEPEKIALVPNTSFIPSPEVDSEVIKLNIRKSPPVKIDNEKLFFNVIKASFMQRRKTLSNGLVNGGIVKNKAKAIEILKNMGLEENVRGEELTLEQFANLSNKIN